MVRSRPPTHPDYVISSPEISDDCVAKVNSLARAGDSFPNYRGGHSKKAPF